MRVEGQDPDLLDELIAAIEAAVDAVVRMVTGRAAQVIPAVGRATVPAIGRAPVPAVGRAPVPAVGRAAVPEPAPVSDLIELQRIVDDLWSGAVTADVLPVVERALAESAARVAAQIRTAGVDVPDLDPLTIEEWLRQAGNRLVGVGDGVWEQVREQLAQGVEAGEGIEELAARVEATAGVSARRARVIARTEIIAASNAASLAQARLVGEPGRKTWEATRGDGRTRPTHVRADGQTRPLGDPFQVGLASLQFPGDPTGPVGEVASCRCTLVYEWDGDDVTAAEPLTAAAEVHTGAMVALIPTAEDAARLAVDGGEPAGELHVTLAYLGDAADIPDPARAAIVERVTALAAGPIEADGFAVNLFNPVPGRDTCVVLGLSGQPLADIHDAVSGAVADVAAEHGWDPADNHAPWHAHCTLIYTGDAGMVEALTDRTGPVVFDRIRVAYAGENIDIPLGLPDGEYPVVAADFDEGKHRRDQRGRFARHVGGGAVHLDEGSIDVDAYTDEQATGGVVQVGFDSLDDRIETAFSPQAATDLADVLRRSRELEDGDEFRVDDGEQWATLYRDGDGLHLDIGPDETVLTDDDAARLADEIDVAAGDVEAQIDTPAPPDPDGEDGFEDEAGFDNLGDVELPSGARVALSDDDGDVHLEFGDDSGWSNVEFPLSPQDAEALMDALIDQQFDESLIEVATQRGDTARIGDGQIVYGEYATPLPAGDRGRLALAIEAALGLDEDGGDDALVAAPRRRRGPWTSEDEARVKRGARGRFHGGAKRAPRGELGGDTPGGAAPADDLSARTVPQLRALARERGITGVSRLRKADLVARLTEQSASAPDAPTPDVPGRDLAALRVPELRALARERGLTGTSRMRKAELVAALSEPRDEPAPAVSDAPGVDVPADAPPAPGPDTPDAPGVPDLPDLPDDLTTLRVAELKRHLRAARLPTTGTKADLVAALDSWRIGQGRGPRPPRPDAPTADSPAPRDPAEVEAAVRDAVQRLADDPGGWVNLADLRDELGDLPRDEQDAALRRMIRQPGVVLVTEANQKSLTDRDRAAAVNIGDQDKYAIAIEGVGGGAPGPAVSAEPPPDIPAPAPDAPEPTPAAGGPVSGDLLDQPLAENTWGGLPGEAGVHFHSDGEIGYAIAAMGDQARMDIDGQPLGDVLGRLATDAVLGRGTSQQTLDGVKALRDRLPEGPARRALDGAVAALDAPDTPVPDLPDGTPEPLRRLAADLHAVPLVRRDPGREEVPLLDIAQRVVSGRLGGMRLIREVERLANARHESVEGKAEIDRAVQRAVTGLERQPPTPAAPEVTAPHRPTGTAAFHARLDGLGDLAERATPDAAATADVEELGGGYGGTVERLNYPDGVDVLRKEVGDYEGTPARDIADSEQMVSLVGRALGAQVPRVVRGGETTLYMDFVDGPTAVEADAQGNLDELEEALDSRFGRRLGLMDLLVRNTDRHDENWMLDSDGDPVGIDNGLAFGAADGDVYRALLDPDLPEGERAAAATSGVFSPFVTRHFMRDGALRERVPLTADDVARARERLEMLRPDFEYLGRGDWLDYALRVLDVLEPRASEDSEPLIAAVHHRRGPWTPEDEAKVNRGARGRFHGGPGGSVPGPDADMEAPSTPGPDLEALIPADGAPDLDVDRQRAQFAEVMDGTYGGLEVRVGRVELTEDGWVLVSATVHDSDGDPVGVAERAFYRTEDGDLVAQHAKLEIDESVRGGGFATAFNAAMENWYRQQGVSRIELYANIDVGGYAWASHGYEWASRGDAEFGEQRLVPTLDSLMERRYELEERQEETGREDPELETLIYQIELGERIMEKFRDLDYHDPEFPTAFEFSQLGRDDPWTETDEYGRSNHMWIGKAAMLGSGWNGVKWL